MKEYNLCMNEVREMTKFIKKRESVFTRGWYIRIASVSKMAVIDAIITDMKLYAIGVIKEDIIYDTK